jgi:superfamily II DNA or RNA helicase
MSRQEKGLLYERYVKDFIIQNLGKNAYLWNECPENILISHKLVHSHNDMRLLRKDIKEGHLHSHKDIGIDIIQIDNDKLSIIQCKNGYTNGLCVDDIAGIMMRTAFIRDVPTFIYYTHCLSRNIQYTASLSPYVSHISAGKLLDVSNDSKIYFVKLPYNEDNTVKDTFKKEITPYSYQVEAANKFKEHFETNNRGILSLPCGCGKTYTSYLISKQYRHIIIISPLREFASQNLNRFIDYGYDKTNTLLVDCDGSRNLHVIQEYIKTHHKLLISCTYNSTDLITECLDLFEDALFIVDEFHNLSKANISDDKNSIFNLLMSNHRILFMSATPRIYCIEYDDEIYDMDCLFGDVVYQMTFRDAIDNKYTTDYKIWLPSVHENNIELDKELSIYQIDNEIKNRCKFLYSCIANHASRKCIVYCKDTEDMKVMMECMTTLNEFYIMDIEMCSISCEDGENRRRHILECFANNNQNIQLLFNIRILNECIDIPVCDSIYISYAPKNKITTMQRISRATRIDKSNPHKIANIYIWCEEYEEILETLSSIKEYDAMFKDKIKINAVDFYHSKDHKEIEIVENDEVLLSNYTLGIKEFRQYTWQEKLQIAKKYVEQNGMLPNVDNINKTIQMLARWITYQKQHYMNNKYMMKNPLIRQQWEEFTYIYKDLFTTREEHWTKMLHDIEEYILTKNKIPSYSKTDKYVNSLATWIYTQKRNYIKNNEIMKNVSIRLKWEEFSNKYDSLFVSNEGIWFNKLKLAEEFISSHNKLPSNHDTDVRTLAIAKWIQIQKANYATNQYCMKNILVKEMWEEFTHRYHNLFQSNTQIWFNRLNNVKKYIEEYNKLPFEKDANVSIRSLARWISCQKSYYKEGKGPLKDACIKEQWEEFTKANYTLFASNEDIWQNKYRLLQEFVEKHKKLPTKKCAIPEIKMLAGWLSEQRHNYKHNNHIMQNISIRKQWEYFVNKHRNLFMTNTEIWCDNFKELEAYIQTYNKLPSSSNKNEDIKNLGLWMLRQCKNYANKEDIMKQDSFRNIWEEFTKKYESLFVSPEDKWFHNLRRLENYILRHNRIPSKYVSTDAEIVSLATWLTTQKKSYETNQYCMKNTLIRQAWEDFANKYNTLFLSNNDIWHIRMNDVKTYIEEHKKLPSEDNVDDKIKVIGRWLTVQKANYKQTKGPMKDQQIKQEWEEFTKTYEELLMNNVEIWHKKFQILQDFVSKNNKIPTEARISPELRWLAKWASEQRYKYKNQRQIMKDPQIRQQWEDFTSKYSYLLDK